MILVKDNSMTKDFNFINVTDTKNHSLVSRLCKLSILKDREEKIDEIKENIV